MSQQETYSLDYLKLLATAYPSIQAASAAMITLSAQLNLPQGTEHFLSDIHGEHQAFLHALKNGSGAIRRQIEAVFGETLAEADKRTLATLIYYPEEKLPLTLESVAEPAIWYRVTLGRLLRLCRAAASNYWHTDVMALLPAHFSALIEELLQWREDAEDKRDYYHGIIETILSTGVAKPFISALAELIRRLTVSRLHIIGDIYDRGPGAHLIMDALMNYHEVDIQWGNHDMLWMGAAAGSEACIANVIRICLRYANLETLENGYGVSLLPLASLAVDVYGDDPCRQFQPPAGAELTAHERRLLAQMHKAITLLQFKLEGQIIQRRPQYRMDDRLLLDKIDLQQGTVVVDGLIQPLLDRHFPTLDPTHPYELTERERQTVAKLTQAFSASRRLQRHVRFLFARGSLYKLHNGNLLYHGCMALNEDGSFRAFEVGGESFAGKAFMDRVERLARQGYFSADDPAQKRYGMDAMWYLWSGEQSPLFGKKKMATFERYFIADKTTHIEQRDPYYSLREAPETARRILQEFGLNPAAGRIINGHVPVKVKRGESPVKADGKLIVIDGGFAKAYQSRTGIAGYTLVDDAHGLLLVAHDPFESTRQAIEEELDTDPQIQMLERSPTLKRVKDTDAGRDIQRRIAELQALLNAYRNGWLKED